MTLVDRCARRLVEWNNSSMKRAIGPGPGTNLDFDRLGQYPQDYYRGKSEAVLREAVAALRAQARQLRANGNPEPRGFDDAADWIEKQLPD